MLEIPGIDTFRYTGPLTAASMSYVDAGPHCASNGSQSSLHCYTFNYTNPLILNLVLTEIILQMPFKTNRSRRGPLHKTFRV